MKQIVSNANGVMVARSPRPTAPAGWVLVKTRYSMISVGTEIAPLRPQAADPQGMMQQAQETTRLMLTYLGKAVRNPGKAVHKMYGIMQRQARVALNQLRPKKPVQTMAQGNLSWCCADSLPSRSVDGFKLKLTTDNSKYGYQAWMGPIAVPENTFPVISLSGELRGGRLAVGLLNGDGKAWITQQILVSGAIDDTLIAPEHSGVVQLVVSNADAGQPLELDINDLLISFVNLGEAGLWRSEMEDQGWGLGYSASGEVLMCGDGVNDLSPGQEVACCGAGWANHAEYIAVPRKMVCPVPSGCSLLEACSTTIGSIALQGMRRAEPVLGEKVVVLGLGLIGQITAQLLKANGCVVMGFDLSPSRVRRASDLGMLHGSHQVDEFAKLVKRVTDSHGADKVIITAAAKSNGPINQAMELVRSKGTVVIVGDIGLAPDRPNFYRKEVNLLMSTSYGPGRYDAQYEIKGHDYPYGYVRWTINRNMQSYMDQIAMGNININALIDKVVQLEKAPEAYNELAHSQEELPLGVVLEYLQEADPACSISLRGCRSVSKTIGPAKAVLVGAGAFGISMLVPKMQALPEYFSLVGLVSADAVRGGNYVRQMRLPHFASDIAEMAANPDVDLLVIATRHNQHASEVLAALQAGKAVFVEKPLATTWEDLRGVEQLYYSLENPPLLMVGFNRRFSPALEILCKELAGRQAPLMILYRLNAGFIPKEHWIQDESGAGRNIGEACHMYDVFRSLTGSQVADINAQSIVPESAMRLRNDNFSAQLRYEDGSQASLIYTASGPKTGLPKERIEVFCDGEGWVVDDFKSLTRASDNAVLWQGEADKGHAREFELLGRALAEGGPTPIAFNEIMETSTVALYVEDLLHGRA